MLKQTCIFLIIPVLLSLFIFCFLQSLPPKSITLTDYVSQPVDIIRDSYGIPHIYANDYADASYAMGYTSSQDRLWQIDMNRRIAGGRLSEMLGDKFLSIDIFMRNIKMRQMAQRDNEAASPEALKVYKAFVAGVNAGADSMWLLPIEYYITRSNWEEYTMIDCQLNIHLIGLALAMTWGNDVLRQQLFELVGEEIEWIMPTDYKYVKPKTFIVNNDELPEDIRGTFTEFTNTWLNSSINFDIEMLDKGSGSNSWSISGEHTVSGKPIIAVDPHLGFTMPNIWYLRHIYLPNNTLSGFGLAGYPTLGNGRSDNFAWTLTNSKTDDADIYVEKILDGKYLYGDEYLPLGEFEEIIKIKGQEDMKIMFKETLHGPILKKSSYIGGSRFSGTLPEYEDENLSFCFLNYHVIEHDFDFHLEFIKSKTIDDVLKLVKHLNAVRQSMTITSKSGDILFLSISQSPIRRARGDLPLEGWVKNNTWQGLIPHAEKPYILNPKKGFLVTANNYQVDTDYKYFSSLGQYFSQGRAERIHELIQAKIDNKEKSSAQDSIKMQQDELEVFAREGMPYMLKMLKVPEKYNNEIQLMRNWDYVMSKDSKEASIYAIWIRQIAKNLLKDWVPENKLKAYMKSLLMQLSITKLFMPNYPSIERICNSPKTEEIETCADLVSKSFIEACDTADGKPWGYFHIAWNKHFPFSNIPFLSSIFDSKGQVGGLYTTVHSTHYDWSEDNFISTHGPTIKFIADLGNSSETYWSMDSGISGNVFSRFYYGLIDKHHYGEMVRYTFQESSLRKK
jgi:penicillin amidase